VFGKTQCIKFFASLIIDPIAKIRDKVMIENGEFAEEIIGVRPWTQLIRPVRDTPISNQMFHGMKRAKVRGRSTAGNQLDVCSVNICLFSFVGSADLSDN